jgi:hypothetical protein
MESSPRPPSVALSALSGLNIVFAIWSVIGLFGMIGMVRLMQAPELWPTLGPNEQLAVAALSRLPTWLVYGQLASQMVKGTLYCAAAFGYFTRSRRWSVIGGTLLAVWILAEQAVLVAVVGQVSFSILAAAAYALLTLYVVHFAAKDALLP